MELNYVENTGPVIRVGILTDSKDLDDIEQAARDLGGIAFGAEVLGINWSDGEAEVTFERS